MLTTHGATDASATRPTPSSCDDEPLPEGSRGATAERARNSPERNPHQDNNNGSGKPHQNTEQPGNAPQPRGQRNNNQKRAQHSSGETSLPPEPTEKDSGSTSPELTTSQHQADNNHRQVSHAQPAVQHGTQGTCLARRPEYSAQRRTGTQGQTHSQDNTHPQQQRGYY
ncbi:hypothetical protein Taro_026929 [Colocasia esculenta]|uniref:Uncharacterized protein n=1 Tax=Colocasia esculenta TaxID=4460 RepID=A0A843VE87_COLES|nr:hypothetical protein [Colocasia esculenta]